MSLYSKKLLLLSLALMISFCCFSQQTNSRNNAEEQLKQVIHVWFTSASKEDLNTFKNLMTDDFHLLAFGKRYNKEETVNFVKDQHFSDMKYTLSNVKSDSGGEIAYITFDIIVNFKSNGKPGVGRAMEVYIFRKWKNEWKVQAKTLIMMNDKN